MKTRIILCTALFFFLAPCFPSAHAITINLQSGNSASLYSAGDLIGSKAFSGYPDPGLPPSWVTFPVVAYFAGSAADIKAVLLHHAEKKATHNMPSVEEIRNKYISGVMTPRYWGYAIVYKDFSFTFVPKDSLPDTLDLLFKTYNKIPYGESTLLQYVNVPRWSWNGIVYIFNNIQKSYGARAFITFGRPPDNTFIPQFIYQSWELLTYAEESDFKENVLQNAIEISNPLHGMYTVNIDSNGVVTFLNYNH